MLPTFPRIIELRRQANVMSVKAMVRKMSPLIGSIGHNIQFEGTGHTIRRADKTVDQTEMVPVAAEIRVPMGTALKDFTLPAVEAYLVGAARQMAQGMSKHFYEAMDESTTKAGMVVDARGGPLTEDLIFDMLEKMDHTFNEDGSWNPPAIFGSPEGLEGLANKATSPEANGRLTELLDRKRDDFRRRQAGRVLAG